MRMSWSRSRSRRRPNLEEIRQRWHIPFEYTVEFDEDLNEIVVYDPHSRHGWWLRSHQLLLKSLVVAVVSAVVVVFIST